MNIDLDGKTYEVRIPPGAKVGRDFEVAVPILMNNLDYDEDESDDPLEEDNGEKGPAVIVNQPSPGAQSSPPVNDTLPMSSMGQPTLVQQSVNNDPNRTRFQY
jgi:hypothetical protein